MNISARLSVAASARVADIEGGDLVLAQAGAERHREDDVVPEARAVLAGRLQERGLLELGERP